MTICAGDSQEKSGGVRRQPCLRRRRIEQPVTLTVADCWASRAAVFRESADVENKRLDWKSQIRRQKSEEAEDRRLNRQECLFYTSGENQSHKGKSPTEHKQE